jgi:serine O-acetyltransferase
MNTDTLTTEHTAIAAALASAAAHPGALHGGLCGRPLPDRALIAALVEDLRALLLPGYSGGHVAESMLTAHLEALLTRVRSELERQVYLALCFAAPAESAAQPRFGDDCRGRAAELVAAFLADLPRIQELLAGDAQAAYDGDPAASTIYEPPFSYPGVYALVYQRLAHSLHSLEVPLIPRLITEIAHSRTGIDIHPGASIGARCFIDHGTGVVVGETAVIGSDVKLYQGVTLGARSFPVDERGAALKGRLRHPIVEDKVTLYANATVLGRVTIGAGSIIGGGVWLTHSVPPGSRVFQATAREERFTEGAGI